MRSKILDGMKKQCFVFGCAVAFVMLHSACTSRSTGSDASLVLRSLDGASASDTMVVESKLPLMSQQQEAFCHIRSLGGVRERPSVNLVDVFDQKYRIIPLETTEDCIVGEVSDVVKDDSLLFVVDKWNSSIFVFGLDGKFVRRIGCEGHAENEYVSMSCVSVDMRNKRVCILDEDSQKLVSYDYEGNFLGKESRYFWYECFAFLGDGKRVLLTLPYEHRNYEEIDSYRLVMTDGKGVPQCGVLLNPGFPKYELDHRQFSCGLDNALHSTPDGVYYMDILSPDTIWRVGVKECVPFLVADFGEPFSTPDSYCGMTNKSYHERINQVDFLRDDFIFTREFGLVNFSSCAIVNLRTKKYVTGMLSRRPGETLHNFFEFAYESNPNERIFLYDWEDNQIVKVWTADEITRRLGMLKDDAEWKAVYQSWPQSDRDILDRLTPEDNPVLVVATFKDF